eukprot:5380079-Prymnesium_polylepis.1
MPRAARRVRAALSRCVPRGRSPHPRRETRGGSRRAEPPPRNVRRLLIFTEREPATCIRFTYSLSTKVTARNVNELILRLR